MKSWNEITKEMEAHRKLHDKVVTVAVGDRVEAPRHGRGTVLAIVGDNAWVQTEVRDYPLTFDVRKLKLVPKPRQWSFDVINRDAPWGVEVGVVSVELTDEVRERLAGLL